MRGKNSHFSVGECGELIFTKGIVGKIFDLRKDGETETVKMGIFLPFLPFLSHFCPIFLNNILRQPSTAHIPCAMPAISPSPPPSISHHPPPPFFSIPPRFPHVSPFSSFSPFYKTPKHMGTLLLFVLRWDVLIAL